MKTLGLYIHIPFCIKKCNYCDFLSFENMKEEDMNSYAYALVSEIERWGKQVNNYIVDTIFLGGGTPTLLSIEAMEKVILSIYQNFRISDDLEFTIEGNPKTFDKQKLSSYLKNGINRLSLGVQTLDDSLLRSLGRIHSTHDFYKSYDDARRLGFTNINTDIMFSIPNQGIKEWRETVEKIIDLEPEHISFYSLKIEEDTPFYEMKMAGKIKEITDEKDRDMYWSAVNKFKESGYIHYEISNAAREGYICRHNMKYWSMKDYLSIGAGAHSYFKGKRFSNETDLNKYIKNVNNKKDNRVWEYENTKQDNISEYIFTGLRKIEGISLDDFEKNFEISFRTLFQKEMDECIKLRFLEINNENIQLTNKGLDLSNNIMARFLL